MTSTQHSLPIITSGTSHILSRHPVFLVNSICMLEHNNSSWRRALYKANRVGMNYDKTYERERRKRIVTKGADYYSPWDLGHSGGCRRKTTRRTRSGDGSRPRHFPRGVIYIIFPDKRLFHFSFPFRRSYDSEKSTYRAAMIVENDETQKLVRQGGVGCNLSTREEPW